MMTGRDSTAALRDEIDTLREEIRQYREALAPYAILPREWRLTEMEECLLRAMRAVGPNLLRHERAMLALYGTTEDAPEPKGLDRFICKIREKLERARPPIRIETVHGRGWRLTPESCAAYDAAVTADVARWDQARRAA
jgi:DNA-binding response OmpR family regulator